MKVKTFECCLRQTGEVDLLKDKMGSSLDLALIAEELGYTEFSEEHAGMFCMNNSMDIIGYHEIAIGTPYSCTYRPADVIKRAALNDAAFIALVHNHPTEQIARPSKTDMDNYVEIEGLCEKLGIKLVDSIVVAGDGRRGHKLGDPFAKSVLVEMAEQGLFDEEKSRLIKSARIPEPKAAEPT